MQNSNNNRPSPGSRPAAGNPRPASTFRPTGSPAPGARPASARPAPTARPNGNSAPGARPATARPAGARPASRPMSAPASRTASGGTLVSSNRRPHGAPQAVARRHSMVDKRRMMMIAAGAVVLLVVIVLILVFALRGRDDVQAAVAPTSTPEIEATFTPEPTAVPTPSPTPEPEYMANAKYQPKGKDGRLPIFRKADTKEKMIAITVDDCFQAENLRTIVQTALDYGGKLTIFPIGEIAVREKQSEILKWAWENGMELENHTYTHSGLYNVSNERLAEEIYKQNLALCGILGVEYQCHFLRPMGGDARNDQRIHAYINQLDYKGVAHWSDSGSGASLKALPGMLKPGAVYLFHTTNSDLEKLVKFIPYAVSKGYRLVTLNELFGYPENETAPLKHISEYPVPTIAPYEYVPVTMRVTNYSYAALQLQEMLIKMGLLEGEADGIYGKSCAAAVKTFQKKMGMEVTGEADPKTQEAIKKVYEEKFAGN